MSGNDMLHLDLVTRKVWKLRSTTCTGKHTWLHSEDSRVHLQMQQRRCLVRRLATQALRRATKRRKTHQ